MKIIKVCGRRASVLFIAGFCLTGGSVLSGCAASKNIPYRHIMYKTAYNYLRAVECQNTERQQLAYEPCIKSYSEDYESYRLMRAQYVSKLPSEEQSLATSISSTETETFDSQLLVQQ